MEKRKKGKKSEQVIEGKKHLLVEDTKRAIESYICLSTIATGILTIIAFEHKSEIWRRYTGWLRTVRSSIPTIATTKMVILGDFHAVLPHLAHLPTFSFISSLIRKADYLYEDIA